MQKDIQIIQSAKIKEKLQFYFCGGTFFCISHS